MPRSTILSGAAGADVPSLGTILKILLGNGLVYNSDDIDYYTPPCMCYYIDGEVLPGEVLELMSPDQSPRSHAIHLQENADRLRAR
jgi:hypothetical protein